MDISFPNLVQPKVTAIGTISFQAMVNGQYIWCEISCDALKDRFGAHSMNPNDLLFSFHNAKAQILQTAHDYLEINGGRPVLLMTVDFM